MNRSITVKRKGKRSIGNAVAREVVFLCIDRANAVAQRRCAAANSLCAFAKGISENKREKSRLAAELLNNVGQRALARFDPGEDLQHDLHDSLTATVAIDSDRRTSPTIPMIGSSANSVSELAASVSRAAIDSVLEGMSTASEDMPEHTEILPASEDACSKEHLAPRLGPSSNNALQIRTVDIPYIDSPVGHVITPTERRLGRLAEQPSLFRQMSLGSTLAGIEEDDESVDGENGMPAVSPASEGHEHVHAADADHTPPASPVVALTTTGVVTIPMVEMLEADWGASSAVLAAVARDLERQHKDAAALSKQLDASSAKYAMYLRPDAQDLHTVCGANRERGLQLAKQKIDEILAQ